VKPASLTRSGDFRRVHSEGRRARRNGINVTVYRRGDDDPARVGYAIRSAEGPAVIRNRIKRRLRAAIARLELRPGVDIVVSGSGPVAELDFQILVEKVHSGLRAVGAAS
jgi:ribonuclease P protein component